MCAMLERQSDTKNPRLRRGQEIATHANMGANSTLEGYHMQQSDATHAAARAAVARILAGVPIPLSDELGPYAEILKSLLEGLTNGGASEARERYLMLKDLTPWLEDVEPVEDSYPDYDHFKVMTEDDLRAIHQFIDTDFGEAYALELLYSERLRFVVGVKWIIWTGMRWRRDTKRAIVQFGHMVSAIRLEAALLMVKDAVGDAERDKAIARVRYAHGRGNLPMIERMLATAATMPKIVMEDDELDRDIFKMGVKNGVLDLERGVLIDPHPEQYITRRTEIPYFPDATCPTWERFLLDVFKGDEELIDYVQRCLGYALTGDIREQYIWFAYGSGSNGKGTFIEIVSSLMGEYASSILFNSLMSGGESDKNDDIAGLRGKRFIFASESERGKKLNEARVKKMTGGDTQRARHLYGEWFEFMPEWKIWVMTNHKPVIQGTDRGIWRRMRLIPFTASFEGAADLQMPKKLRAELPGILAWAVRGCLKWQDSGLGLPFVIAEATEDYRQEMDTLGTFLRERTVKDPAVHCHAAMLYSTYKTWALANGLDHPMTTMGLKRALEERGFKQEHTKTGNIWKSLGLLPE